MYNHHDLDKNYLFYMNKYYKLCKNNQDLNKIEEEEINFIDWLKDQKRLLAMQMEFLSQENDDKIIELNTGIFNSQNKSNNTFIISEYENSFKNSNSRIQTLDINSLNKKLITLCQAPSIIVLYNSLNNDLIQLCKELHLTGNHRVSIGYYGYLNDENHDSNIDKIFELFSQMPNTSLITSETENEYNILINSVPTYKNYYNKK